MSKYINVNPDHYKLAGRERQGDAVIQSLERQQFAQRQAEAERWEAQRGGPQPWEAIAAPAVEDEKAERRGGDKAKRRGGRKTRRPAGVKTRRSGAGKARNDRRMDQQAQRAGTPRRPVGRRPKTRQRAQSRSRRSATKRR
jgi:hypothetical protein